jgi:hypothetical protein
MYVESVTALILANKYSKIRGVIPRSGLGLTSRSLISPSIVYVFPLPVCKGKQIKGSRLKDMNAVLHGLEIKKYC